MRLKTSEILPASLRAGMITETAGCLAGCLLVSLVRALGLATMTFVRARWLRGHIFTIKRLNRDVKPGIGKGSKISSERLITSQSAKSKRLVISATVSQFW